MTWLSDDAVARLRDIAETPDLSGTRYRIVREIGRGGMGVVYEADDLELERGVALKVLANELSTADDAERLRREARIIARLEHPGIVPVHDVGVLPDGRVYYAMQLVRGVRLDAWTGQTTGQTHGLTEKLRLFARICEPVAFAHASGVVHRDLKPENIMVGDLGVVLVMDWGVARAHGEHDRLIVGTAGYMPPEQARGERADSSSDVYALGALLAFLVEGDPLARRLKAIIACARADDPNARYSDARALAEDVLRFLDDEPVRAYRENVLDRAERWVARNRALVVLVAAYVVMRVIVFLWMRL